MIEGLTIATAKQNLITAIKSVDPQNDVNDDTMLVELTVIVQETIEGLQRVINDKHDINEHFRKILNMSVQDMIDLNQRLNPL